MEQRILGRSGVSVSPLCLGAMMFGDQTSGSDFINQYCLSLIVLALEL